MFRIVADYLTLGVWGISLANTVSNFDVSSLAGVAQLVLSALGIIYLGVKIINESLNGRINREGKRIENELANRELNDEDNEQIF